MTLTAVADEETPDSAVHRPATRSFRAYNVGLAKTGTRSMAGIFGRYRSLHELLFPETVQAVADRRSGALSEQQFRAFIRWRDGLTQLDMDSSSFNCYYVDVLAEEFPDARFVFVVRDCFSWLDSFMNMVLHIGGAMDSWMVSYIGWFLGPGYLPDLADHEEELGRRLPDMIDHGLRYWAEHNRFVLQHLPAGRSLILRTDDFSRSIPEVARLVGVPPETLTPNLSHLNQADGKYHCLQMVDRSVVRETYERYCVELMRELFPAASLESLLARHCAAGPTREGSAALGQAQ